MKNLLAILLLTISVNVYSNDSIKLYVDSMSNATNIEDKIIFAGKLSFLDYTNPNYEYVDNSTIDSLITVEFFKIINSHKSPYRQLRLSSYISSTCETHADYLIRLKSITGIHAIMHHEPVKLKGFTCTSAYDRHSLENDSVSIGSSGEIIGSYFYDATPSEIAKELYHAFKRSPPHYSIMRQTAPSLIGISMKDGFTVVSFATERLY
tara:strand:+ start:3709 stop:4332 length:624 start_codon:yes stop_codon:yes gene_type:complete